MVSTGDIGDVVGGPAKKPETGSERRLKKSKRAKQMIIDNTKSFSEKLNEVFDDKSI